MRARGGRAARVRTAADPSNRRGAYVYASWRRSIRSSEPVKKIANHTSPAITRPYGRITRAYTPADRPTSSLSACDLVSPNICLPMPDGPMNTSSESRDLIRAPRLSGGDAPAAGCSSLRCVADVADMLNACVIRSAESYFATSRHRRCSCASGARHVSITEAAGNELAARSAGTHSVTVRRQGSIEPSSVRASQCCVHYSSHRIHFRGNTQRVDVGKGSTHTAHARFAR